MNRTRGTHPLEMTLYQLSYPCLVLIDARIMYIIYFYGTLSQPAIPAFIIRNVNVNFIYIFQIFCSLKIS